MAAVTKGFLHDPINDINQLQQLLRDRYHAGFPIIKELVQNAEDAGARRMDFGWVRRLGGPARHPLLSGPGLFVVNDGPFLPDNAEAIRYLGLSNKPASDTATGKFGLGLKSIFHVCEAFFFLASPDPRLDAEADERGCPRTDVFNPYCARESAWHPSWDEFHDDDRALVRAALAPLLAATPWFCLWIPLRRKEHLDGASPIVERYPAPEDVFGGAPLHHRLAHVLPMLRNLERIRAWEGGELTGRPAAELSLGAGSTRRTLAPGTKSASAGLRGSVSLTMPRASCELRYAGYEAVFADAALERLKASDAWPKIGTIVPNTRRREQRKQVAHPHVAVVFSGPAGGGGAGRLSATWAVTLPVGDEPFTRVPADGGATALTLHGHFFVDAGRMRVVFGPASDGGGPAAGADEQAVQLAWNRLLRNGGLLLLIRALEQFGSTCPLDDEALGRLTAAISKATYTDESTGRAVLLFATNRNHICRQFQWVRRVGADGQGRWAAVPSEQDVYVLPQIAGANPIHLVPGLARVADSHVLTTSDVPRLCRAEEPADWTAEMVLAGLEKAPAELLGDAKAVEYLRRWIEVVPASVRSAPAVADRLVELLRGALSVAGGVNRYRQTGESGRGLLRLIPADRLLPLGLGGEEGRAEALLRALLAAPTRVLPLPAVLWPFPKGEGVRASVEPEDAGCLLAAICGVGGDDNDDDPGTPAHQLRSDAACDVLRSTAGGVEAVRHRVRDYPLFRARDLSRAGAPPALLPLSELESAAGRAQLFRDSKEFLSLATALQRALRDAALVLLDPTAADVLYPEARTCSEGTCLSVVRAGPPLADAPARCDLLAALLQARSADPKTIRYLLHARPGRADDGAPLLRTGGEELGAAWVNLLTAALAVDGEGWRLVDACLADHLSPSDAARFGVSTLSRQVVADVLGRVGAGRVDCGRLSEEDARVLLAEFPGLDDARTLGVGRQILRDLCIHPTVDGRRVSIRDEVYLDDPRRGFDLDAGFAADLTRLRPDGDDAIYARQAKLCDALTPATVIRLALARPQPQRHCKLVLAALPRLTDRDWAEVMRALRATAWVPTAAGTAVTPDAIVHLGVLEDAVGPLLGPECDAVRLAPGVTGAEGFATFRERLIPPRRDALARLGDALASAQNMALGSLSADLLDLEKFLACFAGTADLMPASPLLDAIRRAPRATPGDAEAVAARLLRPVTTPRLVRVLCHLTERCERTGDSYASSLFMNYLHEAVAGGALPSVLPRVRLRNRRGSWRTPHQLCLDAPGVDDEFLLDESHAGIVGEHVATGSHGRTAATPHGGDKDVAANDLPPLIERGAEDLLRYLREWQPLVPPTAIGGLLCTCGNVPALRAAAERDFLGGARVDGVLDRLTPRALQLRTIITHAVPAKEVMAKRRLLITFDEGATTREVNLLGGVVEARVAADVGHLLVGHPRELRRSDDVRQFSVRLRRLPTRGLSPERANRILRETAKQLLTGVGSQSYPDFDARWEDLVKRDQLDVEVTQELLLDHAPHYVRQLRTSDLGEFGELLNRQTDARYRQHEARRAVNRRSAEGDADNLMREARERVRRELTQNPAVQAEVVKALRGRVRAFQYEAASVPFELFQNADDAVVEQHGLLGADAELPEEMRQFVVAVDPARVSFMHWGRAINRPHGSDPRARARRYHCDVEKMLTLSQSDKETGPQDTTGKFGLGFKSVFLVCDRPRVVSRWLAFEVVAGLYPRHLGPADLERLQASLRRHGSPEGTIIDLPLTAEYAGRTDEILSRFLGLVGLTLAFAKRLRRCRVVGVGEREIVWEVGSSRVDLQACKLEYSIVSPK